MQSQSNKNNNINERREEGEYKVPEEVYTANWRDDIEDQAKEEDKIKKEFQFFKNESSYDSRKCRKIDTARLKRFSEAHKQSRLIRSAVKFAVRTA